MAERFRPQQEQIRAAKEKAAKPKEGEEWKTKTLYEKIQEHYPKFTTTVNSINDDLDVAANLKDSNNRDIFFGEAGYEEAIRSDLKDVASAGELAYVEQMKDKKAAKELLTIDQRAESINTQVSEIEKTVPFFRTVENAENLYKQEGLPQLAKVQELLKNKGLPPAEKKKQLLDGADLAIDKVAEAKNALLKIHRSAVPELYTAVYDEVLKPIEKSLDDMGQIKLYYAVQDFVDNEKNSKYLVFDEKTGNVKKTEEFNKLPEEEQQRILLELQFEQLKIKDEIGEKCAATEEEKGYYEAKKLLAGGKPLEAKEKLLKYWEWMNKKHIKRGAPVLGYDAEGNFMVTPGKLEYDGKMTDEEVDMHDNTEELLKQIALMEIEQARTRFEALKSSLKAQWHDVQAENTLDLNSTETEIYLKNMERILDRAQQMVNKGDCVTLEQVLKELKSMKAKSEDFDLQAFQNGFWNGKNKRRYGSTFDVLSVQSRLNEEKDPEKRRQMALEEARKAYKEGLFELARLYYDQYFKPELEKAKKKVSRAEIEKKMQQDNDLQQRIWNEEPKMREQTAKQWREQYGSEISEDKLDEIVLKAKSRMFQTAVSAAYNKAVKAEAHESFQGDMSTEMAREWNTLYSNTFVNLDYFKDRSWYELWKFTPEEWDGFLTTLWVDIAMLVVSMGFGNVAKTVTMRAALSYAARQTGKEFLIEGAEQVLKQGSKEYFKYIIKEVGFKRAAALGLLSLGVESGATTAANTALQKMMRDQDITLEETMKTWGKMALMMGVSRAVNLGAPHGAAGESMLKQAGRYVAEEAVEEVISSGFDIGILYMSGEEMTQEKIRQMLRDNIVYAVGIPAGMAISRRTVAPERPAPLTSADAKWMEQSRKYYQERLGVDFSKPENIKTARFTPDGRIIINGKSAKDFNMESLKVLSPRTRQRILDLAPNSALDTHFRSRFSTEVPKELLPDGDASRTNEVHGWIDKKGNIHYNLNYLNSATTAGGPYRGRKIIPEGFTAKVNENGDMVIRAPDGKEMSLLQFLKTPEGKNSPLMAEMKRIKMHEATHQVLENIFTKESKTGRAEDPGKTKELKDMFAQPDAKGKVPEGKIPLVDVNGKPLKLNWENVQEYLSHVADGSIKLSPEVRKKFETVIAKRVPGFTFEKARNVSTRLLAANPAEAFIRGKEAAMLAPPAMNNALIGMKYGDMYIALITEDGKAMLSKYDPHNPENLGKRIGPESVSLKELVTSMNQLLKGRRYGNMFIRSVREDGIVELTNVDPNNPKGWTEFASSAYLADVLAYINWRELPTPVHEKPFTKPEIKILRLGDNVEITNSAGTGTYKNCRIVDIDPQSGMVTVNFEVNGRLAKRVFNNMDELKSSAEISRKIHEVPKGFSLINANGVPETGWRFEKYNYENGNITVRHIDGRIFEIANFEQLNQKIRKAETKQEEIKMAQNKEMLAKLPEELNIMYPDGSMYEGLRIESCDLNTGMVKLRTRDGRLDFNEMHLRDLADGIDRLREWRKQLEIPPTVRGIPPTVREGPRIEIEKAPRVNWERNDVQKPPEQVKRAEEINMVGDLHGEYKAYVDNLKGLGLIDDAGNWTGGKKRVVFHGDILADRGTESLKIMENIRKLQEQAKKAGGDIILLAGNHEDMAIAYLTNRDIYSNGRSADALSTCILGEQGRGVIEFFQRFATDSSMEKIDNIIEAISKVSDMGLSQKEFAKQILKNMRANSEGRKILEQMCEMRLVEQIDDALFMHTELTPGILRILEQYGGTMGESVDNINKIYQQGLRYLLLGEGSMPEDFDNVSQTFLDLGNRDFYPAPGQLKDLNSKGINYIVHGHTHSDIGENVRAMDGVKIMGVDHSYGKRGETEDLDLSIGVLNKKGQIKDKH